MSTEQAITCRPLPPWLMKTAISVDGIQSIIQHARGGREFEIRCLNGRNMGTLAGVFEEFGKSLDFPDYYGRNSAALEECLNDLSWLPAQGYLLVVTHSSLLLKNEPPSELTWLLALLERVCEEWSRPVRLGEEWDRPAVPFHVVFQDEPLGKTPTLQIASLPG